jgi:Zn-dependent peptidase ImmA (M78 family)
MTNTIEKRATDLLAELGCNTLPVPIDRIAAKLGIRLETADLGEDVSGVLVVTDSGCTIGCNWSDPAVRQRFTIAHEIGHFVLHRKSGSLFIDKQYAGIYKRDKNSSSGVQRREVEANRFAAALLMPAETLAKAFEFLQFDLGDESALEELARKFEVSSQAMSFRLSHLGLLGQQRQR